MRKDQIDFFISCAACLNFSLAAKYHFVSVSTLSRSISALEDELGLKLFDRGYHGHSLTEAGRAFFELATNSNIDFEYFSRTWDKRDMETLVIGCRACDSSYESLITAYSKMPSDFLSAKIRVILIPDDRLLKCLNDGIINIAFIDKNYLINEQIESYYTTGQNKYFFISKQALKPNILLTISKLASMTK